MRRQLTILQVLVLWGVLQLFTGGQQTVWRGDAVGVGNLTVLGTISATGDVSTSGNMLAAGSVSGDTATATTVLRARQCGVFDRKVIVGDSIRAPKLNISGDWISAIQANTYDPTRSAEANMDANVSVTTAQFVRIGNTVTVSGRFTADPTTGGSTTTSFEITLPVASNLGNAQQLAGVAFCGSIAGLGAEIIGDAATDTAKIQWKATDTTSQTWSYTFTYRVI